MPALDQPASGRSGQVNAGQMNGKPNGGHVNPSMRQRSASALIVDDEPDIQQAMQHLFEAHLPDVRVETCSSGDEALERMRQRTFDLVISDFRMPGMDGLDLLSLVVSRSPRTSRILMTAYADLDLAIRATNEGHVDFFLRKPIEPEAVLDAAARALAKSLDEQTRDRVLAFQAMIGRDAEGILHAPTRLDMVPDAA